MRAKFLREVAAAGLPRGPGPQQPVTEEELARLPGAAARYMRFMRVVGRPRTWSLRARFEGVFRRSADEPWMPCEARQYNSGLEVARLFHMRMRMRGLVPVYVRDLYLRGEGHMLGRVLDAVRVADARDEKIAIGELVTWVNDAVLLAPSMLLAPRTEWSAVDDASFDVAVTDGGRTVRARVLVDERGAPVDFSTTDRFVADPARPDEMVRARWTTPVAGWDLGGATPRPSRARAVWHFEASELAYADFVLTDLEHDVSPAD